ncbi:MAG: hypothetical protein KGL11_15030 [Alphaproteobacteria bacterium]|nr:hypothetical protein [Alphaproteobacteria bacterium]
MSGRTNADKLAKLEERVRRLEEFVLHGGEGKPVTMGKVKKSSPREFLLEGNIKSDVQKVLALGYYLEHAGEMEFFNVSDLESVFRSAKEKLPTNINDAVNKNIARGFIMEAASKKDSRKAWCLTSTGERYVETELQITR